MFYCQGPLVAFCPARDEPLNYYYCVVGVGHSGGCECELHIAVPRWLQLCLVTSDPGLLSTYQELSHRSAVCQLPCEGRLVNEEALHVLLAACFRLFLSLPQRVWFSQLVDFLERIRSPSVWQSSQQTWRNASAIPFSSCRATAFQMKWGV